VKIGLKLVIGFLIVSIIPIATVGFLSIAQSEADLQKETAEHLETVAEGRAKRMDTYFLTRDKEMSIMSTSLAVRKALNEKLVADVNLAKSSIKQIALDTAKEIEGYLKAHPDMTVEDLQNDARFQAIAVQPVGETGYTAVTDYRYLICRFHATPQIIDLDLHTLAEKLPGFWSVMGPTEGGYDSEGIYDWEESDGSIKKKYMYIRVIDGRTADGVEFHVAATAYLDEYGYDMELLRESKERLQKFKESYGYLDLFLITANGEVWWTATGGPELGTSLEKGRFIDTGLADVYRGAKTSNGVVSSDYAPRNTGGGISAFLAAPVYVDDTLLGVIASEIGPEQMDEITGERTGMGKTGKTYLVGHDYLMRSDPGLIEGDKILKQKVNTENAEFCFEGGKERAGEGTKVFMDYRGVKVLGTSIYLPKREWCLLAEIDEKEAFAPARQLRDTILATIAVTTMLVVLFSLFLSRRLCKPIHSLQAGSERIGEGDLGFKVRVKTGDELEELASGFNSMAAKLKKTKEELEDYGKTLEKKVKERTTEFEKKAREAEDAKVATAKALKKLDKAYAELKSLENMKADFMNIAAHELKTPLVPIMGYSQFLGEGGAGKVNKGQKEKLDTILKNAKRLQRLTQDILDITKLESGAMKFDMEDIRLRDIVRESVENMKPYAEQSGVLLKTRIAENIPLVKGDSQRLTQVFTNLLDNAIKFTDKGGSVTVEAKKDGKRLLIGVNDTGIGMSNNFIAEKMFKKFQQEDTTAKRKYGGTGLGLSICKAIVENHNGKIWAESEPGKGSTFYVSLPTKKTAER
jgi:signal transduction histidine kinase